MTTATTSSTRTKDSHDAPHGAVAVGEHVTSNQPPARPAEPEVVEYDDAYDNVACTD